MRVSVRRNSIFALSLLLLLAGCRPRGVLSTGKMRDLLYDLHRADAVLQLSGYNYGHDDAVAQYYHEVLASHGVTQAQFDSSLVWYTAHPTRFQRVYPRLINRMEKEQEAYRLAMEEGGDSHPFARHIPIAIRPFPFDSVLMVYRSGLPAGWGYQRPDSMCVDLENWWKVYENEEK